MGVKIIFNWTVAIKSKILGYYDILKLFRKRENSVFVTFVTFASNVFYRYSQPYFLKQFMKYENKLMLHTKRVSYGRLKFLFPIFYPRKIVNLNKMINSVPFDELQS